MSRILVVDDRVVNRMLLRALLEHRGHDILEASDGAEALDVVKTEGVDLVITDILMPTVDGYELVRRLRSDPVTVQTKVIFYTAHYLEREARNLASSCGVSAIITKGSESEVVLRIIDETLGEASPSASTIPNQDFDHDHLQVLTNKLSQKVDELRALTERQEALIEMCTHLASERDPGQLLEDFCRGARDLVIAKYAVVGVLDDTQSLLKYFFASGLSAEAVRKIGVPQVANLPAQRGPVRMRDLSGDPSSVGLPENHPLVRSLLCSPILSPNRVFGWLFLTDKLGADEFTEDDERLAAIFGAQAGRIYENCLYAEELACEVEVRRRAEEEVRRLNEQLEERVKERTSQLEAVNRELEAFNYSVSHDLQAPLRSVDGFTKTVIERYGQAIDPRALEYLGRVRAAARYMGQLIQDLLGLSRLTTSNMNCGRIDLSTLARSIADDLKNGQPRRKVDFAITDGLVATGDPRLLRLVLQNLLDNAWKFTRRQALARIEFGAAHQNGGLVFFVRDNGAGFDMSHAHRLFGAFQRLHSAREFPGTGIGLATVQRIIHLHGGKVWAEAEVGHGATFYFSLLKPSREARTIEGS